MLDEIFEDFKMENKKKAENNVFEPMVVLYGNLTNKLCVSYTKSFVDQQNANYFFDLFEKEIKYNSTKESKIKIFGKSIPIPRKQVAYGEKGTFYNFSGIRVNAYDWNINNKLCRGLLALRNRVNKMYGCNFNFVLINRYADGDDYIGFHADDEKDLQLDSPIVGLTFGAERDFVFKHKNNTYNNVSLILHHGSCVGMHYPTNKWWKHGIPKRSKITTPRINLTFRVMNVK